MLEKLSLKQSILILNKSFHNDYNFICESLKTIFLDTKFDSNVIFLLLILKITANLLLSEYKKYDLSTSKEIEEIRISW